MAWARSERFLTAIRLLPRAGAVGARPRLRINKLLAEARAQQLRGAIDISHAVLHLLDAFAKFFQETRNRAGCAGSARGQDVESGAAGKVQLEFLGVLLGRDLGKAR